MAKVMISIPDDFLAQIDQVARSRHQTRSEYFRELARRDMEVRREATGRGSTLEAAKQAWERIQAMAERMRGVPFDSTAEIRRLRDEGWSRRQVEQVHDAPDEEKST
jgi:metal-responsive CopG/Arc/MetJ family transcriptional regulator